MSNLVFNSDGTVSFDGSKISGVWFEDYQEYLGSSLDDLYDTYQPGGSAGYGEDYAANGDVKHYKLKNHGEIVQFKIQCQTIAIRKESAQYLIDNIDSIIGDKKAEVAKGVTKRDALEIEYQTIVTSPYGGKTNAKASDAKSATWLKVTVRAEKSKSGETYLGFILDGNYYAFITKAADFKIAVEHDTSKKKFKLEPVK